MERRLVVEGAHTPPAARLADTAPVMIWVTDPDKQFTFFNKIWLNFTGRTMEQELGSGWAAGVHPDDLQRCYETFSSNQVLYVSPAFEKVWGCPLSLYQNYDSLVEAVHEEDRGRFVSFFEKMRAEPIEESYRIIRPDGSVRWIHDRAFLVSDPEGKPYRLAGISEDVTAQRELEEQLRQAHKIEAIGRLAGGIAHDFNNLLMIIGGYSQMLLDSTHSDETRRERLEQILGAANRASILTRQLLAFSRRQVLQPRLVDVNRLLANMEALLRRIIGEHITIETALDPALSRIKLDPNQLEQVVDEPRRKCARCHAGGRPVPD